MRYAAEYREKLITADEASLLVKSGDWIQMGEFNNAAPRL